MNDIRLAEGLLYLLRDNPTLLPPAPVDNQAEAMNCRARDEVHPCLRCGKRANCAVIAELKTGPGWVDLCVGCYLWLKAALAEAAVFSDPPAWFDRPDT